MLKRLYRAALLLPLMLQPALAGTCKAVDFLTLALPSPAPQGEKAAALSLQLAYPGLRVDLANRVVLTAEGIRLPLGEDRQRPAPDRLADASILEQFHDPYPLVAGQKARQRPWFDPGRARNTGFFMALYGETEATVRRQLHPVRLPLAGGARFYMSARQNVACQLAAALQQIAEGPASHSAALRDVGGSFNWRLISGTRRLSAHSFGTALDLNAQLGGYWRWSGETEGAVGAYHSQIPPEIVHALERYGFIWGGNWHHYDGMHFEYRPELILHARLVSGG